jgi:hypothetical protein
VDLGQECDRIERAILLAQPLFYGRGDLGMRQRPLTGRRRTCSRLALAMRREE